MDVASTSSPAPSGSARSVLLTVLGDVVHPTGVAAWTGALQDLMALLDVAPATTRQALRRLAGQGLVVAERVGRRTAYRATAAGAARLDEAAARIYRVRPRAWDGRWRLLTWVFVEEHRASRDALRRELGWLGYGTLGTSSYCCPWDRGERLRAALEKHGVHGSVDTFTAAYDGDDRQLAARAYDLPALRTLHQDVIARFTSWRPLVEEPSPTDALVRRVRLVHHWRRTLFLDPGLPAPLVPDDWLGDDASALFAELYRALERPAWRGWVELAAEHGDEPPPVPAGTALVGAAA